MFQIIETRGKEGQVGYSLAPKDTLITTHCFIETESGRSVGGRSSDESAKAYVRSNLLDLKTTWQLYKTETDYYIAYTEKKGISVEIASKKQRRS